ncbi:MAG: hypothetical protein LUG99_05045 [Lachnospiraceae bacterium]|nr:hypothetical protein [Lachnospiraceae bacterium]
MDKKKIKLYIILLVLLIGASILLPYAVNAVSDAIVGRIINHSETEADTDTEEELLTETEDISDSIAEMETASETEFETASEAGDTVVVGVESDSRTDGAGSDETAADSGDVEISGETLNASKSVSAAEDSSETGGSSETATTSSGYGSQEAAQESSEGKTGEADTAQSERLDEMETYVSSFQPEITVSAGAENSYSDFLDGREMQFLEAVGEYVYSIYDDMVSITKIEIVETVRNNDEECSCQIELYTDDGSSELFICSYNKKWDYYGVYSLYSVD